MKEPYVFKIYWNNGKDKHGNKWFVIQEHRPNGRGGIRIKLHDKKFKTKAGAIEYRNKYIKPKLRKINTESGKHKCRVCNKVKPLDKFKKHKINMSHGIEGMCKECHNNISKKDQQKRDDILVQLTSVYKDNFIQWLEKYKEDFKEK